MSISCSDICEEVTNRLLELGLPIDTETEDHTDIVDALARVSFVLDEPSVEGE